MDKITVADQEQMSLEIIQLMKVYNDLTADNECDDLNCDYCIYNTDSIESMRQCLQCLKTAVKQKQIDRIKDKNSRRMHK